MSANDWLSLVQTLGLPVLLLVIALIAGARKKWVWGYQLDEAEKRADKWERYALRGTSFAEKGVDVAQTLIEVAKTLQGGTDEPL